MGWILQGLYAIASAVIGGIAWLINQLYAMVLLLADIDIFEKFAELKKNVFLLLGLFMLFKLAFSVIQYIIDPDKMTDSTVGFQKLIIRIVVSLALLGTIDQIFDAAKKIQDTVLEEHVLESILFSAGDDLGIIKGIDEETGLSADKKARYLSFVIFSPFVRYDMNAFDDVVESCEPTAFMRRVQSGVGTLFDSGKVWEGECAKLVKEILSSTNITRFEQGLENFDIRKSLYAAANAKRNKESCFDIDWLMAPIVGIICLIVLIVICVNVAIRAIKLSFLRLIAPIPIIMYMVPNDKNDTFKKWLNMTIKTYLDLFIRLISFYFAIYIITEIIGKDELGDFKFFEHPLLHIFFIIGTLLFALQFPKIINELTGMNTDKMNKGIRNAGSVIGAAGLGVLGGTAAGVAAGVHNIHQHGLNGGTVLGTVGNAITGGASSMVRSGWNARNGGNFLTHARTGITSSSVVRNANAIRDRSGNRVRSRIPFVSSTLASFRTMAGLQDSTYGARELRLQRREYNNALTTVQNEIQDAISRVNNAQASLVSIDNAERESQAVMDNFARTAGTEINGEYRFDVNGVYKSFDEMTESEFKNKLQEWRTQANNAGGSFGTATLVELNSLENAYSGRNSARNARTLATRELTGAQNDLTAFRNRERAVRSSIDETNRNIETLNNANNQR